jgi:hypothetical protein
MAATAAAIRVFINLSNNQSRDSLAIQTFLFFGKLNMGSDCPQ